MKKIFYLIFLGFILVLITACDKLQGEKYEFSKDLTGQTIRLDKRTGEMVIINGNHMERVKNEAEVAAEKEEEKIKIREQQIEAESKKIAEQNNLQRINQKIIWKSIKAPSLGGVDIGLATSWTNGKINYKFSIDGVDFDAINKARDNYYANAYFNINFEDVNGFRIYTIYVPIKQVSQVVNENNKVVGYKISDSVILKQEIYQSIATWSIGWGGFN